MDTAAISNVAIGLNAVLAVVEDGRPKVLCVREPDGALSLPYGPFDPATHRTFEIGLREWVERQTAISLGYVEQLYTFGDLGREAPAAAFSGRGPGEWVISVGYLALTPEAAAVDSDNAQWRDWYDFFPWEDWRRGEPAALSDVILPRLEKWAAAALDAPVAASRRARIRLFFGGGGEDWEEERALDRYELMYEAGLIAEAARDRGEAAPEADGRLGLSMASDHRRILATAIGRLRGKLKYRPIIFRLLRPRFTLLALQKAVEAIIGYEIHKQNFRRSVDGGGFVERTTDTDKQASGRPAALFKVSDRVRRGRVADGLAIPRLKSSPAYFAATAAMTAKSARP
ncbi:MAG: NAD regulator [Pseudomonadota bacterium]